MCVHHAHGSEAAGPTVSRRRALQGMVSVAALAACTSEASSRENAPRPARPAAAPTRLTAYSLAMHLHSSGSEGPGSVRSHLAEAATNGIDVAWFAEHDWVRNGTFHRKEYHFLPEDQAVGGTWLLPALPPVGRLRADSGGQLLSTPTSPNDRATDKGSLRLRATSSGRAKATVGHRIDTESRSMVNVRGRILGRSVLGGRPADEQRSGCLGRDPSSSSRTTRDPATGRPASSPCSTACAPTSTGAR